MRISNAFEMHLLELSNWSLDEPFQRRYPELRDACKLTGFHGPHGPAVNGMNRNANIS